jgi:hypothetical protein
VRQGRGALFPAAPRRLRAERSLFTRRVRPLFLTAAVAAARCRVLLSVIATSLSRHRLCSLRIVLFRRFRFPSGAVSDPSWRRGRN